MSLSRKDEMREQCQSFHRSHPEVWDLFVLYSRQMIDKGYRQYSAQSVFERIRWEKDAGGDGVDTFKLNNNYVAFYARRFMTMYPQHEGFFRTREQKSKDEFATHQNELTPRDYA